MQIGDETKQNESVQLPANLVGSFDRDLTLAAGAQAVTGLGFRPSSVIFFVGFGGTAAACIGASTLAFDRVIMNVHDESANQWSGSAAQSIFLTTGVGIESRANLTTFDIDGFTVAWTKGGAPSGTVTCMFIAFK